MWGTKKITTKEHLSKHYLLNKIGDVAIYRYYLGYDFKLKHMYHSPFREDSTPSFNLYYSRNGEIHYKDFGHSSGDIVNLVQNLYNLGYKDALNKIYDDLVVSSTENAIGKLNHFKNDFNKENCLIQFEPKPYSDLESRYWEENGISLKTLKIFNTYSAKNLWLNKKLFWQSIPENPIFVYHYPRENKVKAYRPLAEKNNRFICNVDSSIFDGMDQLPESGNILMLTKARKDVMLYYEYNIPAISPMGESVYISDAIIDSLFARFPIIYVNYDPDEAGMKAAIPLVEKGMKEWYVPDGKDISGFRKKFGKEDTGKLLKQFMI